MEILNKKQKIIVVVLIIIMCIVIGYYIISKTEKYDYSDIEKISNIIEEDQEVDDNIIENKIVIHITGEVEEEGVIELEKGARISDAIEEAGGTTEEADLSNVNLAYSLSDGQKVKIPNINVFQIPLRYQNYSQKILQYQQIAFSIHNFPLHYLLFV